MRPTVNTITLCGSTRFMSEFMLANHELTMLGMSCFSVSMALDKNNGEDMLPVKELLDLVHFNKILRSDAVLVIARGKQALNETWPDGMVPYDYIGFSTAREIMWAYMQNKLILSMSDYCTQDGTINDLGKFYWRKLVDQFRAGVTDYSLVDRAQQVLKIAGDAGRPG